MGIKHATRKIKYNDVRFPISELILELFLLLKKHIKIVGY